MIQVFYSKRIQSWKYSHFFIDRIFEKIIKKVTDNFEASGIPTKLMLLKFACNLFSNDRQDAKDSLLLSHSTTGSSSPRDCLTHLVVETLLSSHAQLRQAAALAVYNMSWVATALTPEQDHDDAWSTELLAAVASAIESHINIKETNQVNDETGKLCENLWANSNILLDSSLLLAFRLIASAGLLLGFAHESVIELGQVIGLSANLQQVKSISFASTDKKKAILGLCDEITSILEI
jgi:hypothetical protein